VSRHVIISPARNEGKFIQRTIDSVAAQTVPPVRWVIVDDGSSDDTFQIATNATRKWPWISVLTRKDRGGYSYGKGIIEAFNEGLQAVQDLTWDFVTKLDCDLEFDADYFERVLSRFSSEQRLGIAGGTLFIDANGQWIDEKAVTYFAPGPAKTYRRQTFDQIGGLVPSPGWDTMDAIRAWRMRWKTETIRSCQIRHLRPTGANVNRAWNYGRTFYVLGGNPLFFIARCAYRLRDTPVVVGSMTSLLSYSWYSVTRRIPRWPDSEDRRELRRFQVRRLCGGTG
jgi:biofilm PGA synthesis N-glycosyltransferase PgaC